ncbi:hypothetical protein NNJEOMEG_03822 [Fundidesulfovibrio magnetotacticus]|uniref:Caspase family p20 domain-containing protein n=1 Tax=Fundidesulfovibrio magnetotacticus TaxID=2730080 RepID=A0A6V8M142_9BACT|nr:caspase family protein [Fundidesulfovibrio magnetotacticus]GFK95949.1 hypothetical protein NNJEOMEG_03822 [Fundidesulfovibrio magnetotacticus]
MRRFTPSLLLAVALAGALLLGVSHALAATKSALVIGNADYEQNKLDNPANDARDMANALRQLGFEVIHLENADKRAMLDGLERFGASMSKEQGSVAFFYYAGHGVQVRGVNYLLPLKEIFRSAVDAEALGVKADHVLGKMEEAGCPMNIVVLDACRDNPFARSLSRAIGGAGLAQMGSGGVGAYISFATSPGKTAEDGDSRNGLYTKHLLEALRQPGLTIEQVFKRTREGVIAESQGGQVPWDHSSLRGDFYFIPAKAAPAAPGQPAATLPDNETLFWQTALAANNPAYYRKYLEQFPTGAFAALAKLKLEEADSRPLSAKDLKPGMKGFLQPDMLRVDLKGGLWIKGDATIQREPKSGLLAVAQEEDGLVVDISSTTHRWERSGAPTAGYVPVARVLTPQKPQPVKVSTMTSGQKGWLEPTGMIVDASGAVWLRPDQEVTDKPKAKNSVQVERTATGYVVHLSNTTHRWEKKQVAASGSLPVERLEK